jgi:DNA-directed RNA polymerase alpha subunit
MARVWGGILDELGAVRRYLADIQVMVDRIDYVRSGLDRLAGRLAEDKETLFIAVRNLQYDANRILRSHPGPSADDLAAVSIADLNLSTRTTRALRSESVYTLLDIVSLTDFQLRRTHNFGKRAYAEVIDELNRRNLRLAIQTK